MSGVSNDRFYAGLKALSMSVRGLLCFLLFLGKILGGVNHHLLDRQLGLLLVDSIYSPFIPNHPLWSTLRRLDTPSAFRMVV